MFRKKFITIVIIILVVIIQSCKNANSIELAGCYEIDKNVKRNQSDKKISHNFLNINPNHTFKLSNINDSNSITGRWEIIKYESNKEGLIEFSFENKVIQGKFNDAILSFEYPNDFYSGLYESVLYVKLSKAPEGLKD